MTTGSASAPRDSISAATLSTLDGVRAARTTRAPSRAHARAASRPIPGPIPEIIATRPSSKVTFPPSQRILVSTLADRSALIRWQAFHLP